jgi:hypothetical protein
MLENPTTAGSFATGVGNRVLHTYVGKIRTSKTGAGTGTVQVLFGANYADTPLTVTGAYSGTTVTATVTLPTAFPTTNIAVIAHIDSTSSNHYTWTVICSGRTISTLTFTVIQNNGGAWSSGSVDFSFVAYCLPI